MKTAFKWFVIIITAMIFLYAFSSSYYSQNIDHLDYVIALGIDEAPNSDDLLVTFEFANLSSFSENSSGNSEPILNSIVAPTISNAITIINAYLGKQLNLSHCKVIVISKDFAKRGILDEISVLINNIQIRPTTNVVISESKASNYLKNSTSSLEQILTKYYDIFPTSSEYTGYTSNIPLGLFYENIVNKNAGAVSLLGNIVKNAKKSNSSSSEGGSDSKNSNETSGDSSTSTDNTTSNTSTDNSTSNTTSENSTSNTSADNSTSNTSSENSTSDTSTDNSTSNTSSENSTSDNTENTNSTGENNDTNYQSFNPQESIVEGDHGVENMGLAVFKDDKYVGTLSTVETLCYTLLKNEVDNFIITLDDPFDESEKIDISIIDLSSLDIDVDILEDKPVIHLKFNLIADVVDIINKTNLSHEETLKKYNEYLKEYLTKQFIDYLNKTSKEYKSDINEFYINAKSKFLTNNDFDNYNWSVKYENAEFNVEFNDDIISTLIIRQSN